jgi:hypothetical protein
MIATCEWIDRLPDAVWLAIGLLLLAPALAERCEWRRAR